MAAELSLPTHKDVRDLIASAGRHQQVVYLVFADPFVLCTVQLNLLCGGTLDSLPAAILEALRQHGPLSFNDLSQALGLTSAPLQRVLAETIGALERAQGVAVAGDILHGVQREWEHARMIGASEQVFFIPASGERQRQVPRKHPRGSADKTLVMKLQTHPDVPVRINTWSDLYERDRLSEGINMSYARDFAAHTAPIFDEIARNETLQRSRLQTRANQFLSATITHVQPSRRYRLHRCYIYQAATPGGVEWTPRVMQYTGKREVFSYTSYLIDLFAANSAILEELLGLAKVVPATDTA